jgi:ATP-dependent helicase/DNAse subunit B
VQKQGFDQWRSVLSREDRGQFNYLTDRVPKEAKISVQLKKKVWQKGQTVVAHPNEDMPQILSISATDLNEFFTCPLIWLYRRIFNLREFSLDARLLDEQSLGILFHRILKELFTKIKQEDIFFKPDNLDKYFNWIWDITNDVVRKHHAFRGPLAVPLLISQAEAISKTLRALLKSEAKFFPGYAVSQLEYELEFSRDTIRFIGRLDRISISPDNEHVIIDYKTNVMPSQAECIETKESPLRDFQMPMYIKLYEEKNNAEIGGAFFFSIYKHDASLIVGKLGRKKKCSREDYQPTIDALEHYIEYFHHMLNMLDLSINKNTLKSCYYCEFKTICRTTYRLNDRMLPLKG